LIFSGNRIPAKYYFWVMLVSRRIPSFPATIVLSFLLHLFLVLYLNRRQGHVDFYLPPVRDRVITVSMPLFKNLNYSRVRPASRQPPKPIPVEKPPVPEPVKVEELGEIPTDLPVQEGSLAAPVPEAGISASGGGSAAVIGDAGQLDNDGEYQPLYNPRPLYPPIALAANIEGFVELEILINEQGLVENYKILKVTGHPQFGTEVEKVLPSWRFPPPRCEGKPVKFKFIYIIKFEID
jgi:protein TonB